MTTSTLNTLALLRIAPLISSSASLFYCADQHLLFSSFITSQNVSMGSKMLPGFWSTYLTPSLGFIVGLYSTSALTGCSNAYSLFSSGPTRRYGAKLYAAGATLSFAHFIFGPLVAVYIDDIVKDIDGKRTASTMRKWLNIHIVRSLLVDLPAWTCFLLATCDAILPL